MPDTPDTNPQGQDASGQQVPARPYAPGLRKPPMMGGPRRTTDEAETIIPKKSSVLKKALPYLIATGSTGLGIGGMIKFIF